MQDRTVTDLLLQPFQLKHLLLKNRIMTTSHEPAYPEDGMPKSRYRAYHTERARGGVALTMDLSRFRAAPSARLGHFPFEGDRAFPAQR